MEQDFGKYLMFKNRLEKIYRHLSRQAKKQGVSCYRLYDHDIPEFPFMIEFYGDKLYVAEYKRNHGLSEEAHAGWLDTCKRIIVEVLMVSPENIFFRTRQRKEGRLAQYQKLHEEKSEFIVEENGLK